MFVWCLVLFILGIVAFLDSIFHLYGNFFRQINSMFFMLISLGILVRTATKMNARKIEGYEERIGGLESQINKMKAEQEVYKD